MKTIKLTKGQVAIVDDADFEWLSQWRWYAMWNYRTKSYYAFRDRRNAEGKKCIVYMTRLILGLERGDKRQADHIHHATLDNRRSEIRVVTNQENQFNLSNAKGYSWRKKYKKYEAQIRIGGKAKSLGSYDTPLEAHTAYLVSKGRLHIIPGYESHDYLTVGVEG